MGVALGFTAKRLNILQNNDASTTPGMAGYDFSNLDTYPYVLKKRIEENDEEKKELKTKHEP